MMKHWSFKTAGVLLALVLMTSCFVGGTFAKYTTAAEGMDSARVAKFGVTITANGTSFAKEYATNDAEVAGMIANSVVSTDKVIAPGTNGNMVSMTLTGTPEVAVKVTYEATVDFGDKWVDNDGIYYCPLEIKVGEDTLKGTAYASAAEFAAAVKAKIDAYSKQYAAGTDLSEQGTDSLKISWAWAFEGNEDAKDTYLGDQAADNNVATVSIKVKTTVTQIDQLEYVL